MGSESSTEVVLNCLPGVQLDKDTPTEFIIALPPVEFTKGFIVTITDTESNSHIIETSKVNTVLRSSLLKMPVVAVDGEENTPLTSYWAGKKFVINGDSVVYGSGLSSVYDGFSYLVAEHFGSNDFYYNWAPFGDFDEVNPEDCAVYMSVPTGKNAPPERFYNEVYKGL